MAVPTHEKTASSLLEEIAASGTSFKNNEPGAREKLLVLNHELTAALELPSETLSRMAWAEPAKFATCKLAVDLKIFDVLAEHENKPVKIEELAKRSGVDITLLSRAMKHLAAMNVVGERGIDQYIATSLTEAFTKPELRDGITYLYDVARPAVGSSPAYLQSIGYKCPTSITDAAFQYAHQTQAPFWQWVAERPPYPEYFNHYMTGYRLGKASWLDQGFYPFQDRIVSEFEPNNEVLLVDVGGGLGHDLLSIKEKQDNVPGKLILQDLPGVIAKVATTTAFESMAHDFFTPQPVTNARAYYLHSVLHDWNNEDCCKILRQLTPSMKKGYSKVLINELVVPDVGAPWGTTSLDWLMMSIASARERTEKEWRELLSEAGLNVVSIFTYEPGTESIIEAELA